MTDGKEKLLGEIQAEVEGTYAAGRLNSYADLSCSVVAIAASFMAAIFAATQDVPGWLTATIAALSGLSAGVQRVVDFRGRAAWSFGRSTSLSIVARNLKFTNITVEEGTRQFNAIDKETERAYSSVPGRERERTAASALTIKY